MGQSRDALARARAQGIDTSLAEDALNRLQHLFNHPELWSQQQGNFESHGTGPRLKTINPFGDFLFHDAFGPDGKLVTRHFDPNGLAARAEEWAKQLKTVNEQMKSLPDAQKASLVADINAALKSFGLGNTPESRKIADQSLGDKALSDLNSLRGETSSPPKNLDNATVRLLRSVDDERAAALRFLNPNQPITVEPNVAKGKPQVPVQPSADTQAGRPHSLAGNVPPPEIPSADYVANQYVLLNSKEWPTKLKPLVEIGDKALNTAQELRRQAKEEVVDWLKEKAIDQIEIIPGASVARSLIEKGKEVYSQMAEENEKTISYGFQGASEAARVLASPGGDPGLIEKHWRGLEKRGEAHQDMALDLIKKNVDWGINDGLLGETKTESREETPNVRPIPDVGPHPDKPRGDYHKFFNKFFGEQ
jgi:hypothetical protein